MSPRFWMFLAAIFGGLSVVAGALGAHALSENAPASSLRIFNSAQLYHSLHALALLGVGLAIYASEQQRGIVAGWMLQIAAAAFTIGMVCFSGGIYLRVAQGALAGGWIVPFGGTSFIAGWLALAIGSLGLRLKP